MAISVAKMVGLGNGGASFGEGWTWAPKIDGVFHVKQRCIKVEKASQPK